MAYDLKNVFYLDTSAEITAATAGSGTAQLDLSAYIDPIARGRTKGTGLAIYKVHFVTSQGATSEPIDDAEAGSFRAGLVAGLGVGDNATGGKNMGSRCSIWDTFEIDRGTGNPPTDGDNPGIL